MSTFPGSSSKRPSVRPRWKTSWPGPATLTYRSLVQRWKAENERDPEDDSDMVGEGPTQAARHERLAATHGVDGRPYDHVTIANLPTKEGWQSAATLNWGGWNECPSPQEHVAAHHHCADTFGSQLVTMTGDTLEATVSRPPSDRQSAMELAEEHYAYCPDIVEQGVGTISALAATLLDASLWFFWWD